MFFFQRKKLFNSIVKPSIVSLDLEIALAEGRHYEQPSDSVSHNRVLLETPIYFSSTDNRLKKTDKNPDRNDPTLQDQVSLASLMNFPNLEEQYNFTSSDLITIKKYDEYGNFYRCEFDIELKTVNKLYGYINPLEIYTASNSSQSEDCIKLYLSTDEDQVTITPQKSVAIDKDDEQNHWLVLDRQDNSVLNYLYVHSGTPDWASKDKDFKYYLKLQRSDLSGSYYLVPGNFYEALSTRFKSNYEIKSPNSLKLKLKALH